MSVVEPTLDLERELVGAGGVLACVDEVGRGALAGPVSVGLVAIDPWAPGVPEGVRDSKLLSLAARERLEPEVRAWVLAGAVGHASPGEIDELGIVAALRLAGRRAWDACLNALGEASLPRPSMALLDGNLDWLSAPPADLFAAAQPGDEEGLRSVDVPVRTQVKGDRDCLGVGAASILAKVERDRLMEELALQHPAYGWERNKGYGSAAHRAAILGQGPCDAHRRSWKLI
ncbi:MAG: ribonuclease HII [Arthrobacter sp.]|nr:ribonuclease HII [Arthrobacter sp.]